MTTHRQYRLIFYNDIFPLFTYSDTSPKGKVEESLTQSCTAKFSHETVVFSRRTFHEYDMKRIVHGCYKRRDVCATMLFIFRRTQNGTATNLSKKDKFKFILLDIYFGNLLQE